MKKTISPSDLIDDYLGTWPAVKAILERPITHCALGNEWHRIVGLTDDQLERAIRETAHEGTLLVLTAEFDRRVQEGKL